MEFNKDLFMSICKDYGVEFSNEYDKPMIKDYDGELKPLNEFLSNECSYCKNGTYRKSIYQPDGTLIRRANFCDNCGRDLRHL